VKRFKSLIQFISVAVLMGALIVVSQFQQEVRPASHIDIRFDQKKETLVDADSVNKLLIQNKAPLASIPKETLVLKEMEARLVQHPMVYQAQVFISIDGEIGANIQTKKPIGRVLDSPGFYIDEQGQPMPLSNLYTARVPIVTGEVLLHLDALKELLLIIRQDAFLERMITEVAVDAQGNIQLELRQEKYKLLLGPVSNVTEKVRNFKAFYQNMRKDQEQKQFKKVDLRFNNQVVATE